MPFPIISIESIENKTRSLQIDLQFQAGISLV